MEIKVSGRHLDITDAIREFAIGKVSKLTRYFDRISEIDVVADSAPDHDHEVEIIVTVEHHAPFVARTSGVDLYACIDQNVDKLSRQLSEHKDRLRNHKHNV